VVGPQSAGNGVVAIDAHTARSDAIWEDCLTRPNNGMSKITMRSCGAVRRST
jgi:hypothetical protein